MHPTQGVINETLELFGVKGPGWLTNPNLLCCRSRSWMSGRASALQRSFTWPELLRFRRNITRLRRSTAASALQNFWNITLPLLRPATVTVIILSLIGGLRSFDLIWAMTRGGPGFTSDVMASVIYKQYQAGFYGLSTAGNVVLFVLVAAIIVPLILFAQPERGHAMRPISQYCDQRSGDRRLGHRLPRTLHLYRAHGDQGSDSEPVLREFSWPSTAFTSGTISSRWFKTRDYMLVTAFINTHHPDGRQRHTAGGLRRHGRLRPATQARRSGRRYVEFPRPRRPDHPAGGRPHHLGAARHRPLQHVARA